MKPFAVTAAVLMWVVVAVRIRTLTRGTAPRLLWAALVAITIGLTLDIPSIAQALDELPGVGTNVPHLVKHSLAVVAAGAIGEVVRRLVLPPHTAQQGGQRRALLLAAAVTLLVVLFALAPVHDQPLPGLTSAAADEPALLVYWAIYTLAVAAALVGIVRVTRTAVTTFPAGPLRTGMAWMGAGATVGLAYCAHKAFSLVASTATAGAWPPPETTERVQAGFVAATFATFAVGVLWPGAVRWPVVMHLITYRAHRQLYPLWNAYYQAEPGIALNASRPGAGRALRDIELALYRRVIEIRDGMLAVRPYAQPGSCDVAQREADNTGCKNPSVVAEAAWLEVARRAKLRGRTPFANEESATKGGGEDLDSETRALVQIAKSHKAIQLVADRIEAVIETRTTTP